ASRAAQRPADKQKTVRQAKTSRREERPAERPAERQNGIAAKNQHTNVSRGTMANIKSYPQTEKDAFNLS
uniref:hypothetical protein n=1 Tax=Thiolapillus sp. TaxID=2017437 RepID=UPI003AF847A6